jgi:hypothetical protein
MSARCGLAAGDRRDDPQRAASSMMRASPGVEIQPEQGGSVQNVGRRPCWWEMVTAEMVEIACGSRCVNRRGQRPDSGRFRPRFETI